MGGPISKCCCDFECYEDGCFVYATTTAKGWIAPEYKEYPATVTALYRTYVIVNTIDWYYNDPDNPGDAIFWATATKTYTYKIDPFHNELYYKKIVGSVQGTIYEATLDFDTCTWEAAVDLDPEDYITEQSPYYAPGSPFEDPDQGWVAFDMPEKPDVCPIDAAVVGAYSKTVTAVGTATLTVKREVTDLTVIGTYGAIFKVVSVMTVSDGFSPTTIGAEASTMLLQVPLQIPNQLVPSLDILGDPDPKYFGFASTAQSPYGGNVLLISKQAIITAFCGQEFKMEFLASVGPDEVDCATNSVTRIESYHPAARTGSEFSAGGTGDGVLYEADDVVTDDGVACGTPAGLLTATGYAKKSLLARTLADEWTAFVPYDVFTDTYLEDEVEFLACDTTECFRYYYPAGGDSKTESAACHCKVFTLSEDGIIYRWLPIDLLAESPCPSGLLPAAFGELVCP
jgi:hypothetical protein